MFSDETPICLIQVNARRYVRQRRNTPLSTANIRPTVQGGGKIMVWGAFRDHRMIPLRRVVGNLNGNRYIQILEERLHPFTNAHPDTVFQQDNCTCHTGNPVRLWMQANNINLLPWPARSPDLSPIENLWADLKRRLENEEIQTLDHLWQRACQLWINTPLQTLERLVQSMPHRIAAVIAQRGGPTRAVTTEVLASQFSSYGAHDNQICSNLCP
jgi:transposase